MRVGIVLPQDTEELAAAMKKAYSDEIWNESWSDKKAMRRTQGTMSDFEFFGVKAVETNEVAGGMFGFVDSSTIRK